MARWVCWLAMGSLCIAACDAGSRDGGGGTSNDVVDNDVADELDGEVESDGVEGPSGDAALPSDTGEAVNEDLEPCIPSSEWDDSTVSGHVYSDEDLSDQSIYSSGFDPNEDVELQGIEIALIGVDGERVTATCEDGSFAFIEPLGDISLVAPVYPDEVYCTTKNCPRRVPDAVREGAITMVTFGDSVPVVGADILFPEHLAGFFEELAEVIPHNVAVGGSISDQWLPGTNYYNTHLVPLIPEADVMVVSLGGNDVMQYVGEATQGGDLMGAINGLEPFVLGVMENVLEIVAAIRAVNPDVDVVYCLYPNYALSSEWDAVFAQIPFPGVQDLVVGLVVDALDLVRSSIDPSEDIVLVDFYGAMNKEMLDLYLYDQLHYNEEGHVYFARQIFRALGGVVHSPDHSLGVNQGYGFTPLEQ